jgi:hypothetical protein
VSRVGCRESLWELVGVGDDTRNVSIALLIKDRQKSLKDATLEDVFQITKTRTFLDNKLIYSKL